MGVRVKAKATTSKKYEATDKKRTKRKSLMAKNEGSFAILFVFFLVVNASGRLALCVAD